MPATARALEPPLAGELAQRAPDGDQAAAVARASSRSVGRRSPGAPLAGVERRAQVEVDLVVQRDGTELESEAGHRARVRGLGRRRSFAGLCGDDC